jgi:hypothetical protein
VQREPIVVTGAGCVSALDHSVAAFWSALQDDATVSANSSSQHRPI